MSHFALFFGGMFIRCLIKGIQVVPNHIMLPVYMRNKKYPWLKTYDGNYSVGSTCQGYPIIAPKASDITEVLEY